MSKDVHGVSVDNHNASNALLHVGMEIQAPLGVMARAVFPRQAAIYRETFIKVYPYNPVPEEGIFTGQVVVHNMVVHQHRDNNDGEMCAFFNVDSVNGGHLYFPQLEAAHW
jgi:hypothetical protein